MNVVKTGIMYERRKKIRYQLVSHSGHKYLLFVRRGVTIDRTPYMEFYPQCIN